MANGNGTGIKAPGQPVVYRDGAGLEKAAIITGTWGSIKKGTDVTQPAKGSAHLRILHPTKKDRDYVRENVSLGEGPRTFSLV